MGEQIVATTYPPWGFALNRWRSAGVKLRNFPPPNFIDLNELTKPVEFVVPQHIRGDVLGPQIGNGYASA